MIYSLQVCNYFCILNSLLDQLWNLATKLLRFSNKKQKNAWELNIGNQTKQSYANNFFGHESWNCIIYNQFAINGISWHQNHQYFCLVNYLSLVSKLFLEYVLNLVSAAKLSVSWSKLTGACYNLFTNTLLYL